MLKTNTLAYLASSSMAKDETQFNIYFKTNFIKRFKPVIYECSLKARVFGTGKLFQSSLMFVRKASLPKWSA